MKGTLIVHCYQQGRNQGPNKGLRAKITEIFEKGVEEWAGTQIGERKNSECPSNLLEHEPKDSLHPSGFIIQEPSKFAQPVEPVWISSFAKSGNEKQFISHVDGLEWKNMDLKGNDDTDGDVGLKTLFGEIGLWDSRFD